MNTEPKPLEAVLNSDVRLSLEFLYLTRLAGTVMQLKTLNSMSSCYVGFVWKGQSEIFYAVLENLFNNLHRFARYLQLLTCCRLEEKGVMCASIVLLTLLLQPINAPCRDDRQTARIANHKVIRVLKENDFKTSSYVNSANDVFDAGSGTFLIAATIGIYKYDETANSLASYEEKPAVDFTDSPIAILGDNLGGIWLYCLIPPNLRKLENGKWVRVEMNLSLTPEVQVFSMSLGTSGLLWFPSDAGVIFFDRGKWGLLVPPPHVCRVYDAESHRYPKGLELPGELEKMNKAQQPIGERETEVSLQRRINQEMRRVAEVEPGDLWIGAERGIFRVDTKGGLWTFYPLPTGLRGSVWRIYRDRSGQMWFCDEEARIASYDRKTAKWTSFNLSEMFPAKAISGISAIYQDQTGVIWFGTNRGLATVASGGVWQFYDFRNSALPGEEISFIKEDRLGRIWIGTSGGIIIVEH